MTADLFRPDWKLLLLEAAEIVRSYDTSVTLRQLFYQLVSSGRMPNTINAYKSLSRHSAKARRNGDFPDLIDRVRSIHFSWFYSDVSDALDQTALSYRLDRTVGQQYGIYLGVEKAGILEQLELWFDRYGFPMLAIGGYDSQSHVDQVVRHVRDRDRPAILIYAGDFDASGKDIYRDFIKRADCWDQVRHVAVRREHIQQYGLTVNPGKETDSRAKQFAKEEGTNMQVELDALRPDDLRELYRAEIAEWWDEDAYDTVMAREEDERRGLQQQIAKWRKRQK